MTSNVDSETSLTFSDGVIRRDAEKFSHFCVCVLLSNTRLACEISVPVDNKLWTEELWMPQFVVKLLVTIWFCFTMNYAFFLKKKVHDLVDKV